MVAKALAHAVYHYAVVVAHAHVVVARVVHAVVQAVAVDVDHAAAHAVVAVVAAFQQFHCAVRAAAKPVNIISKIKFDRLSEMTIYIFNL